MHRIPAVARDKVRRDTSFEIAFISPDTKVNVLNRLETEAEERTCNPTLQG